jgi:hypothetical protein
MSFALYGFWTRLKKQAHYVSRGKERAPENKERNDDRSEHGETLRSLPANALSSLTQSITHS